MGDLEISSENEKELVLKAVELCGSKSSLAYSLGYKNAGTCNINKILTGEAHLSRFTLERLLIVIQREENRKRLRDARLVQS